MYKANCYRLTWVPVDLSIMPFTFGYRTDDIHLCAVIERRDISCLLHKYEWHRISKVLTFSNLAGPDPRDVEVAPQKLQLLP